MKVIETPLAGLKLIETDRFTDDRGWFMEVWNEARYAAVGLGVEFVQTNVSFSQRGVLRGMHFQSPHGQGKLVSVLEGAVFDVAVDLRQDSATFGRWHGSELTADNGRQLWIPEGFAHGFLVLAEHALVHYSCTAIYRADCDHSLAWNDPDVGIAWPSAPRVVSAKDQAAPSLRQLREDDMLHGLLSSSEA